MFVVCPGVSYKPYFLEMKETQVWTFDLLKKIYVWIIIVKNTEIRQIELCSSERPFVHRQTGAKLSRNSMMSFRLPFSQVLSVTLKSLFQ